MITFQPELPITKAPESILVNGKIVGRMELMDNGHYHAAIKLTLSCYDYVLIQGFSPSSKEEAIRLALANGLAKAAKDRAAITELAQEIGRSLDNPSAIA